MRKSRLSSGFDVSDLGPFHGDGEGYAGVCLWLMAVEAGMLLVLPWVLVVFSVVYHPGRGAHRALSIPFLRLGILDVLGMVAALSFWMLWKRLSAKIAEGGAEARFLDRVRTQVGSLMQAMIMLLVITGSFFLSHGK